MLKRILSILCVLAVAGLLPVSIYAYDFNFGENAFLELKGDLTYSARMRTEDPDPLLKDESKGNSNFKKGDLVNNKMIARMEMMFDAPYVTFFSKFEAFYDSVYTDDKLYPDDADVDVAKQYAVSRADAKEYYLDLHTDSVTLRLGKQIVEWGELAAPVFAPGVNIMNLYDGSRIAAAGYTIRDFKVPAEMAWLSMEVTSNLSLEAAYSQDFEPRSTMPVVGTFGSYMDILGYGGSAGLGTVDNRPTDPEDMQQYGAAARMVFPSLGNLEMGLFHGHYINFMPSITMDMSKFTADITYEEVDMYGFTLSQVFGSWQTYGEFSYRPNQPAQLAIEFPMAGPGLIPVGGIERVRTLNWGLGGFAMISDFLSSTPWTVQYSPMIEFYGGINLDYDEEKNFTVPEQTIYFMSSFTFSSSDMIDNTGLTYTLAFSGALHEEESELYSIGNTLTARVGDNIGLMLGYDIKTGDPKKALDYPNYVPDRDAVTCGFTWYFM